VSVPGLHPGTQPEHECPGVSEDLFASPHNDFEAPDRSSLGLSSSMQLCSTAIMCRSAIRAYGGCSVLMFLAGGDAGLDFNRQQRINRRTKEAS
jgi:hypothetical protein